MIGTSRIIKLKDSRLGEHLRVRMTTLMVYISIFVDMSNVFKLGREAGKYPYGSRAALMAYKL